ncbi:hypothetical protein C8J44_2081 [Sphingomonas sp. PP-CE-3A-406]|nr:hypothetical protein C8J44_2081 [Sphingomonas sp. PP-CE-3A-406]
MLATVILTKVRIQSNGWRPSWLWILTFVRMTEETIRGITLHHHPKPPTLKQQ